MRSSYSNIAPKTTDLSIVSSLMRVAITCIVGLIAASCTSASDLGASVARIEATACNKDTVGSAFAVEPDLLMTNAHVLAGVTDAIVVVTTDGSTYEAVVEAFDPELDIALLRARGLDALPVRFSEAETGESGVIAAVGRGGQLSDVPYLVVRHIVANSGDIYDEGAVTRAALELEAEIDPGMSGAGLFDESGHVVGMAFAENRNAAITYAIEQTVIRDFLAAPGDNAATGRCRR